VTSTRLLYRTHPRHSSSLGDQARSQSLARAAGRRLQVAHKSPGEHSRRTLVRVYVVNRSRGLVPHTEKRAMHPAFVSSVGAARQGQCPDGLLDYALWVTLTHLLKRRAAIISPPSASGVRDAQPLSAMKALALLSTLQSADIVLPTTDGPRNPPAPHHPRQRRRRCYSSLASASQSGSK
jgi:hypothetical protein